MFVHFVVPSVFRGYTGNRARAVRESSCCFLAASGKSTMNLLAASDKQRPQNGKDRKESLRFDSFRFRTFRKIYSLRFGNLFPPIRRGSACVFRTRRGSIRFSSTRFRVGFRPVPELSGSVRPVRFGFLFPPETGCAHVPMRTHAYRRAFSSFTSGLSCPCPCQSHECLRSRLPARRASPGAASRRRGSPPLVPWEVQGLRI